TAKEIIAGDETAQTMDVSEAQQIATGSRFDVGHEELRVTGVLGEGGMGRVLLATQSSLGREVALKVIRRGATASSASTALLSEATITGALEHPNIVPVHVLAQDDAGLPVMVMKRIDGVPWIELIEDPAHPAWASIQTGADDRLLAHLDVLMT